MSESSQDKRQEMKGLTKLNNTNVRLQSIRFPRDLSLGGTKIKKKAYLPNLNIVRHKDKVKDFIQNDSKKKRNYEKPRAKNDKQRFMQSSGVFSEGIGATNIPRSVPLKEKKAVKTPKLPKINLPTVSHRATPMDFLEENIVINEVFQESDDSEEEKPPFTPILWNEKEIKTVKESEVKVETPECTLRLQWDAPDLLPREYSVENVKSCSKLTLWQLPDMLPIKNVSKDIKHEYKLRELSEGKIGKILVRKSGKFEVYIGEVKCELEPTDLELFSENAVAVDPKDGAAVILGEIERRFLLNPDWESLLA